jgi:hypothetical protein
MWYASHHVDLVQSEIHTTGMSGCSGNNAVQVLHGW